MKLRIQGFEAESIVDGPGLRLAVFAQGCPLRCPGCHNPATHDVAGGYEIGVEELAAILAENPLLAGLTLSGGEPFLQPGACLALALAARAQGKNVWAYTGYTLEQLQECGDRDTRALLGLVDVLVDGPFVQEQRSLELRFRGSANQRIIDMNKSLSGEIVLWRDPWDLVFAEQQAP